MFNALRRCSPAVRQHVLSNSARLTLKPLLGQISQLPQTALTRSIPLSSLSTRSFSKLSESHQNAGAAAVEEEAHDAVATGPATKFQELADSGAIHQNIIHTITQTMGLETMTQVQSLTIHEALKGKDVLAQAKTGTGKTIGFLLPLLQNIITEEPSLANRQRGPPHRAPQSERASDIRALIISPTRELAEQIAEEARKLTQGTSIIVQTAVGGTQKSMHLRQMQREGCHILVGTPGRLKDIFSDRTFGVQAPRLSAFVLDEADRLLDQGFWPEIQAIQHLLPSRQEKDRQTLMFSATVPTDVVKLVRTVMKPDLHYVRTVQENEQPTHERVPQRVVAVAGFENQLPTLLELCQREINAATASSGKRPFKAIVYFGATVETKLAADIFFHIRRKMEPTGTKFLADTRVFQIHSRLSQNQRTAAAEYFRNTQSAILMSSDVTSRGMDFPGVTHVIQLGLPKDQDTYVHRIGRTGRAGSEGEGWLIIPQEHVREMRHRLAEMPIEDDETLSAASVDLSSFSAKPPQETAELFQEVATAAQRVEPEDLEKAYLAMLGVYQWVRDKQWLIESLNRLAKVQWGMEKPPNVGRALSAKLGLDRVQGINIGSSSFPARKFGDEGGERRTQPFGQGRTRTFEGGPRSGGFDRERAPRTSGFGRPDSNGGFDRPPRTGGFGRDREGGSGGFGGRDRSSGGFERSDKSERPDRSRSAFSRNGGGSERGRGGYGGRSEGGDRQQRGFSRERSSR